jgi:ubiquinone biosynthesis protein COQ9
MASKIRMLRPRPLIPKPCTRSYYSYDHPPPPGPFNAVEKSILASSIPHVPSHGFTQTSLSLGARATGYIDASTNLFPSGAFSLVHYHLYAQRTLLAQHKNIMDPAADQKQLGTGAKVKALTWERLMGNKDIIHRWQEVLAPYGRPPPFLDSVLIMCLQALALMAQPSNIPTSISELASLSDEIWFLAGDTSVDTSWYTKRASLSSIYAATELFMTTDTSTEFSDTKEFLDRRFQDVQAVGSVVGSVGEWVGFTGHAGLNILRSKGVRI